MPNGFYTPIDAMNDQTKLNSDLQTSQIGNLLKSVQAQSALQDFQRQNALRSDISKAVKPDGSPDYQQISNVFMRNGMPEQAIQIQNASRQQSIFDYGKGLLDKQGSQQGEQQYGGLEYLSDKDLKTMQADMKANPSAPAQFMGNTGGQFPSFGQGIGLNQAGVNAGAQTPGQIAPNDYIMGVPANAAGLDLMAGDIKGLSDKVFQAAQPKITKDRGLVLIPDGKGGMKIDPSSMAGVEQVLRMEQMVKNQGTLKDIQTDNGTSGVTTQQDLLTELIRQRNQQQGVTPQGFQQRPIVPGINQPEQPLPATMGPSVGDMLNQPKMPFVPTGPSNIAKHSQEAQAGHLETQGAAVVQQANNASVMKARLDEIGGILERINTGPGTDYQVKAAKVANAIGQLFGVDIAKDKISNWDELEKSVIPIMADQSKVLGTREAASIVMMIKSALPNGNMTKDTLNHIVGSMNAISDYSIAKLSAQEQWRGQDGSKPLTGFESAWAKTVQPGIFALKYLSSDERANLASFLKKSGQWGSFQQSVLNAEQQGILK